MKDTLYGVGLIALIGLIYQYFKGRGAQALLGNLASKEADLELKQKQTNNNAQILTEEEKRKELEKHFGEEIARNMSREQMEVFFNEHLNSK